YACRLAPKTVVLVHGDPQATASMQAELSIKLPGSDIIIPTPGKTLRLD
ncbi:MAG: hypothetical protein IJY53_08405, partial [Akkermansia sp.]|nr:hypothetical protein [Akkermansia sp.]